jgi:hypothetical protein
VSSLVRWCQSQRVHVLRRIGQIRREAVSCRHGPSGLMASLAAWRSEARRGQSGSSREAAWCRVIAVVSCPVAARGVVWCGAMGWEGMTEPSRPRESNVVSCRALTLAGGSRHAARETVVRCSSEGSVNARIGNPVACGRSCRGLRGERAPSSSSTPPWATRPTPQAFESAVKADEATGSPDRPACRMGRPQPSPVLELGRGFSRTTIESINRGRFNHIVDVCMRLDGRESRWC